MSGDSGVDYKRCDFHRWVERPVGEIISRQNDNQKIEPKEIERWQLQPARN
jgi:hypothetical protein